MKYEKKEIYGGAVTVQFPVGLTDASDFRQIPDTQEVFISSERSEIDKYDGIIIDLMEKAEVEDFNAIFHHLSEISNLNGVDENSKKVLYQSEVKATNFPSDYAAIVISGQEAKKWGRDNTTLVILLGLIRVTKSDTDLLVTYNAPFSKADELEDLKKVLEGDTTASNKAVARINKGKEALLKVIDTIKIEDWSLFG